MPYRSSSPDPLSASTAPTITEPPRRSRSPSKRCSETPVKRRFMSPSKSRSTSAVSIHSPTKMTATSNSVLSPWRIKVVVQAERDDDEEEDTSPSGRGKPGRTPPNLTLGFGGADYDDDDDMVLPPPKPRAKRSRSRSVGIRTKTTTVKVKGLSSSPEKPTMEGEEPKVAPKGRKATPARRPATPAASRRGSSSIPATISKSIAGNTPKKAPVSKPAATPKRKRTAKTPAKAKAKAPGAADRDDGKGPLTMSEETNQNMTEAPAPLPAARTEITTTVTKQAAQTTRSTRRKPQAPPTIPTLASTRSRRSTIVLSSVAGTPKSLPPKSTNKTSSVATDGSATRSVTPRRALSGMDPNSLLSPSPSKSNSTMLSPDGSKLSRRSSRHSISSSRSTKTTEEDIIVVAQPDSFRKQELDSFVVSEGGSMSLPDFQSLSFPPSLDSSIDMIDDFGDLPEQDEDMSEEEALADVSKMDSGEAPAQHSDILKPDYDFTFVSTGNSYTPRVRKKRPSPTQGSPLFHDNPVGIETFYGSNDGADDDKEEEVKDVDMESSAMLPEEFSEPAEADFTYMPNGISYTPRTKQKNGLFFSDSGSPLFKDNPVGTETFYGIPSSSSKPRDGGKGKAVDGSKGEITPEESPDHMSPSRRGVPKNQSFYPSSPPFEVVIPSPKKSIATPSLGKRNHDADVPDAPASRKRTDRETPSLIRVQEASEIMSDALDVDEAMTMAEQHFGDGFEGPPTPESKDQSPEADEEMENHSGSYANLPKIFVQSEVDDSYPSFDTTGIPSPPLSQHPEMLSPPTKTPEAVPAPPPAPAPSSGTASYFARIFSPLKRGGSSKTTNPGTKTQTPVSMSWASTGPTKTPDTIRSVRFTDEPSKAREQPRDHTADLEAEWAREREENIRKAQVVGAIMINDVTITPQPMSVGDRTKALQEEWERERSMVRRQAKEVGAITLDDTQEDEDEEKEEDEESFEGGEVLNQDTAAFEESLARLIESEERGRLASSPFVTPKNKTTTTMTTTKSRINTQVFTTRSIASSRSSPPPSTTSTFAATTNYATTREQAHIYTTNTTTATTSEADGEAARNNMLPDSLLDTLTQPVTPSSSGLVWTKENYRHLAAIISSRSTDPKAAKKRYSVKFDRPGRILAREVVKELELDEDMYLQLTLKESAAVERFCRREAVKGREWDVIEVVRRTAGLRVAAVRREFKQKRR